MQATAILQGPALEGEALDRRVDAVLDFLGDYFMSKSPVHQAADEIAAHLEEAGIDYAIAGALALGVHGFVRATEDVHVIVTREGLERFKDRWLGRGYVNVRAGGKPVRDTTHNALRLTALQHSSPRVEALRQQDARANVEQES